MLRTLESKFSVLARFALGMGIASAIGATAISPVSAQTAPNPYPPGSSAFWAWQNRPDLPVDLGPSSEWARSAAAEGWPVGPLPRPGDVAVFPVTGPEAAGTSGFLAVVKQVFDDGSYSATQLVEQACTPPNVGACQGVESRTYPAPLETRFIHYMKDTRTTWGFGGGASGWTAVNTSSGLMRAPGWYYPLAGGDAELASPELQVPLAAYDSVQIDMVTDEGVGDPTVQVFFSTAEHPDVTYSQRLMVKGKADGGLHTYSAYFGANDLWGGTLTRLYVRPAGSGSFGGVRVDRVRLVKSEPPAPDVPLPPSFAAH